MAEPVRYTILTVVALAYLGGGVLVLVGMARVALSWSSGHRPRPPTAPVDPALRRPAAEAMEAVARLAGVEPPDTLVVALLGAPTVDGGHLVDGDLVVGDGGLAVTRFRPGRPATVVFAQAALAGLSPGALQSLAAHELGHVIRRAGSSAVARYAWLFGYLLLVLAGVGLSVLALVVAPGLAGPAVLATMVAAVAFLALHVVFDRREEIAADRFAIALTRDLTAANELMRFYEEHLARPAPRGRLDRLWARIEQRWFATHPPPAARLEAMRRHLVD